MRIRLERLGPGHAGEILTGQDEALAREIVGRPWDRERLEGFLARCARWREDGPVVEFAALEEASGRLLGGGGLNRLAPGLGPGQVALTYWLLAEARGSGLGAPLAAALADRARDLPTWRGMTASEAVLLIAPDNIVSQTVARTLGARPTGALVAHPAGGSRQAERWVLDLRGS
ncbi:GNAT family N-acetyltransferase [Brachybacterium paraconglomeratum]|uniref:GNAT family N-acetyltransferase n=1 Tax=Brachybacterium paraconglomeratum TaxID=173362 RepID=UPI0037C951FF